MTKIKGPSSYLNHDFIERVKRSYRLAMTDYCDNGAGIWAQIDNLRRPVHDALMATSNETITNMFENPVSCDLFYGMDNLANSIETGSPVDPTIDQARSDQAAFLIGEVTHALGLRRWVPESAEQYRSYYKQSAYADPPADAENLLRIIERELGFLIDFPSPFRGERGLVTQRGLASYRAIQALYQVFRVQQELATVTNASVLEIGPGNGRTAYYAVKAGISRYATIDLPMGVVAQACFLGATLGPDKLWMIGDDCQSDDRVRLLPSNRLDLLKERFGVVLNVDSMTEMGEDVALHYVQWIASNADIFLSINHEANVITIPSLARRIFGTVEYRRFPYWMRPAYIEEIFRMKEGIRDESIHESNQVRISFLSRLLDTLVPARAAARRLPS